MKKAALYGLAGNPPHKGHWGCVRQLVERGYFVVVSPSAGHAFGKSMAPYAQRLHWCREGLAEFCSDLEGDFEVWDGEERLRDRLGTPAVYSIDALRELAEVWPGRALELAVGPDNADPEVFKKFKDHDLIVSQFGLVTVSDQGALRSTQIRELLGRLRETEGGGIEARRLKEELADSVGRSVMSALEKLKYEIQGGYESSSPLIKGPLGR